MWSCFGILPRGKKRYVPDIYSLSPILLLLTLLQDVLADLTFAASETKIPLASGPLREQDFETEEFHFEYSSRIRSPRIYNDMITLRSGDIMVKLAISHAIAQSTKLCRFEERMAVTMLGVQHIPKKLALTGKLGMRREDVVKMSGRLFKLRVDVNLCKSKISRLHEYKQ